MSKKLRREFIKLLREDEEFRYTIAGLLGMQEIIKSLENIGKEQKKLREDFNKMLKRIENIELEQRRLREDFNKLREDFNKMLRRMEAMDKRLMRLERTVEKLTVDIEDEARSFIKYRLEKIGIKLNIGNLVLPEGEINIYGANDIWCVIGEASLRAGTKILDELLEKYNILKKKYPGYLREKTILVLYISLPLPELIDKAREKNIWLLKATEEFVPLDKILKNIKNT